MYYKFDKTPLLCSALLLTINQSIFVPYVCWAKKKQRKLCPDKATSDFYWFTMSSYGLISKCILYDNIVLDLMSLPSLKAKLLALNWCESESAKYINVYIVTSSTTNKF